MNDVPLTRQSHDWPSFYYEDELDGKVVATQTNEFYDYGATVDPNGVWSEGGIIKLYAVSSKKQY